jgi:hypothetical protein
MLDAGYWILDTGYWMLDTGYWILDTGYWILDTGYWILDAGYPPLISRRLEIKTWGTLLDAGCSIFYRRARVAFSGVPFWRGRDRRRDISKKAKGKR